LERLSHIVEYAGEKYKSATEVKEMLDTSLMGYGQVVRMEGEQKGKLEAARNALKKGLLSMEQIAQMTDIPVDELKNTLWTI
jgi:predicted transposase YdaD